MRHLNSAPQSSGVERNIDLIVHIFSTAKTAKLFTKGRDARHSLRNAITCWFKAALVPLVSGALLWCAVCIRKRFTRLGNVYVYLWPARARRGRNIIRKWNIINIRSIACDSDPALRRSTIKLCSLVRLNVPHIFSFSSSSFSAMWHMCKVSCGLRTANERWIVNICGWASEKKEE